MTQPAPLIELTVGPVAHGGHFVARHEGRVIFVRHALPGERVRVRLTEYDDGARFWRGDVAEVLEAAERRRPHVWAAADSLAAHAAGRLPAGGAEFGHIDLARQRELKADVVREQLQRVAGLEPEAVNFLGVEAAPGEHPQGLHWRTRMAFAVADSGRLAMHAHRSEALVAIDSMPLATEGFDALGLWEADFRGFERVEVAVPAGSEAALVLLVPAEGASPREAERAAQRVARGLGAGASVALLSQSGGAAADGKGGLVRVSGRTWLAETVAIAALGGEAEYRVTGEGFWQIHRAAPAWLADGVLDILQASQGQAVADLYAGAGLFTRPLAELVGEQGAVLSLEGAPGTSRDARRNLHGLPQAAIRQGRVERHLSAELAALGVATGKAGVGAARRQGSGGTRSLDGVVLDPPRAGAGKDAVRQIAEARPGRIAYVSCDPASFARDASYFRRHGYALKRLRGLDLYPNTHHVEVLGHFEPE